MSVIDRREALKALVTALPAGSLAACSGTPAASPPATPAAQPRAPSWSPALFTVEQALTVEDVAEQLVPETDTPGARSAGVPAYVESVVQEVLPERERVVLLRGIDALNARASAAHERPFHGCSLTEQQALLSALAAEIVRENAAAEQARRKPVHDPLALFWLAMRTHVIEGYLRSRLGATRHFAYEPVPGEYEGCVALETVGKTWAL